MCPRGQGRPRSQDFQLEGANHKSHALTSSKTTKEEFLRGQRYRRMEDQKPWPGVGTQIGTRSRRGLKQIPKVRKCLNWETCLSKEVYCNSNVTQTGVWSRRVARNLQWGGCFGGQGAEPPATGGQWGSGGEAPSARKCCIFLQK